MGDLKTQKMKFLQSCTPVLDDGEYRIRVGQVVNLATTGKEIPEKTQLFSVKGPRYSLDPGSIDSMFPPSNTSGFYGNCLPHIILKRKTLPWERVVFKGKTAVRIEADVQAADVIPWLAVLTFDSKEAPVIEKKTANDILNPGANVVSGNLAPDTHVGESTTTPCLTIDVPSPLFNAIMPNLDELPYLSHVRSVDMDYKKSDGSTDGYYSLVIGNRLPLASGDGEKNVSLLVSLEGLGEHIPGGSQQITDKNTCIRMIVLAIWEYSAIADKFDFKKLLENLSPATTLKIESPPNAGAEMKAALDMGYTAMNHHLRDGEQTASWYRGPLVPLKVDVKKPEAKENADALYKYNPDNGLFDISYAAAWQIGRLLALKNKNFAIALFQWRRGNNQKAAFNNMMNILKVKLPNIVAHDEERINMIGGSLLHELTLNYMQNDLGQKMRPGAKDNTGLLGKYGDPAGLIKHGSKYPGLLSIEALEKIVASGSDIVEKIVQEAREDA